MLRFNYVIQIIKRAIFNTNFLKFIIFHFYIVSVPII